MRSIMNRNRSSLVPVQHGGRVDLLQNEMNRLFDNFFSDAEVASMTRGLSVPAIDILEDIKHFEVRAELPGLDPKDVEVTVAGGFLTITGGKSEQKEEKDRNYVRCETSSGSFRRTVGLPETADGDKAETASFRDGVLSLIIPKKAEALGNARKIPVKRAG